MTIPVAASGHIRAGLSGAFAMALGRREGMDILPADPDAPALSFWAVGICLPAFVVLRLLAWSAATPPDQPVRTLLAGVLLYIIGWAGYAVLSHRVVAVLGRAALWPRYIVAWNWCNVVQYTLFIVASLPGVLGVPDWMQQTLSLIALFWALWLEWFAARLALQIGAMPALMLVGLDVLIGLLLAG